MSSGFMGEANLRRLPVYLLLDCSGSMAGDPIIAVNEGLGQLYRELINNPRAVETASLGVITFGGQASKYPLTPIDQFQPPALNASGGTPMGGAFRALADSIGQDLKPNANGVKGDYSPLVFLLTDGEPTDEWQGQVARLKSFRDNQRPTIIALGCGSSVNESMLHQVTENVFLMANVSPETLRAFFKWVSGSIARVSNTVGSGSGAAGDTTFTPPTSIPGITYSSS